MEVISVGKRASARFATEIARANVKRQAETAISIGALNEIEQDVR